MSAGAQVSADAHRIIDTLASPAFDGRGYLHGGDRLAADFIRNRFLRMNLKEFPGGYYQYFSFNVNTFPERIMVVLQGDTLRPGEDFLVMPWSCNEQWKFRVCRIDSSILKEGKRKKFILKHSRNDFIAFNKEDFSTGGYRQLQLLLRSSDCLGTSGVIETTRGKLTMDMSQEQLDYVHLVVKRDKTPKKLKTVDLKVKAELLENYQTQNVIGFIRGTTVPDSFLVLTAHYDHLGQMGAGTYFPGANDNASGISMLLELAAYYKTHPPKYSVVFMAFSGEEVGLLGSKYYTEHPLFPLGAIKFLINLDIVGTGDEGIKVVNGALLKEPFDRLSQLNEAHHYLKSVQMRGKAANSDHYFFYEKGVPSFFIYTLGGIDAYHDVHDRPETLPLTRFDDLYKLLIDFENSF